MMYENFSYGRMNFKLPYGVFECQGINSNGVTYYGRNNSCCICCDVVLSYGENARESFEKGDLICNSPYANALAQKYNSTIERGRWFPDKEVIEQTVFARTLTLHVKTNAYDYFSITVSLSYDKNIPMHELRAFAYEVLNTVRFF